MANGAVQVLSEAKLDVCGVLRPRSIAIVGASTKPSSGRSIIASLNTLRYPGAIYPVNPGCEEVLGHRCYASVEELPDNIDLAAFCIGNGRLVDALSTLARKGLGAATIYAGGFAETSGECSKFLNDAIVRICIDHGIALCGTNCMGVLSPASKSSAHMNEVSDPESLLGNVGLISQSGSICNSLIADCRRYGFSYIISSGNEAVLTLADYLEFLIRDDATKVTAIFAESIRDPSRFMGMLDVAANAGKPVVVLKAGKSERAKQAILTHTGNLAGQYKVFNAMLRARRAIEVHDIDELCEVLAVCQGRHWPRGRCLAVVTGSGGQAELILDRATAAGIELAPLAKEERANALTAFGGLIGDGNPLDAWGDGNFRKNYPYALDLLGRAGCYDAVALCIDGADHQPVNNPGRTAVFAQLLAEAAAPFNKPFYCMSMRPGAFRTDQERILRQAGIALVGGSVQGLGAIYRVARWAQPPQPLPSMVQSRDPGRIHHTGATISEHAAKQLLEAAGIEVTPEWLVQTLDAAAVAAEALGYPVVLKVFSDDIPHKSDFGLVAVGLQDRRALYQAWSSMQSNLDFLNPPPKLAGSLVQKMIAKGVEVFIGVTRDPDFGPAISLGLGGTLVGLVVDVALKMLPLRRGDAVDLINEAGTLSELLGGVRGAPPADVKALCSCVEAVGDFAYAAQDDIAEVDINPVIVLPIGRGYIAVDALMVPR